MTFNQISQSAVYTADEISVSLTCCGGSYGGGSETLVVTYQNVCGTLSPGGHPDSYNGQDAWNDMLVTDERGMHGQRTALPNYNETNSKQPGLYARCTGNNHMGGCNDTVEPTMMSDRKGHNGITDDGTSTTLNAQEKERPVIGTSIVRRLTPLECTRLQGFPDGWVEIGDWVDSKGRTHKDADSPKYKALGNSIALPFWEFLARRICAQYERPVTMGSLFDGIGGFPLAFERAGAKAVWASEIEEFPIAVTKKHFPEVNDNQSLFK